MLNRLRRRLTRIWALRQARRLGVICSPGVVFNGRPIIDRSVGGTIRLGERVVCTSDPGMTALAASHPVVLRLLRPGAVIDIGADVGLSGTSVCAAVSVTIGAETLVGADAIIADTDFHPVPARDRRHERDPRRIAAVPVAIGRNVFIGARCIILKGVTIGDNSVIGAGSVVSRDVPADVVAAGNPCRVLGPLPAAPP